ncbi:ABC transporter ATP-binding protein [Bacillus sp. REN3]|uniref:ABC transporter ATP-binding protein n=1 Tax=Bacillus sp. REN3 TaxID=2802440 RepID=UPI001AEDA9B9|nr:ABC transporter ATP-binding protein [Bacillus sp. REN3]
MDIQLRNVSKKFENKPILQDFNLNVEKGDMIAITGQSGTGKSTLLNIIGLLDKPDSGEVIIQGTVNAFSKEKKTTMLLRNTIGYLFQNYALIEQETVSRNLDIALAYTKSADKRKLKRLALERVGLLDKMNNKVYQLSGGEQQRVALARLMLKKNDIILADEPTGSLDELNRNHILEILRGLNEEQKTIIIVTHDPEVARQCKRVINL